MFRKCTVLVGVLALLLVVPQAHAAKGEWMINFNGGTGIPLSSFKDAAKLGFMGGVGADYMVTEALAIGVDGSYMTNSGSDALEAALTAIAGVPVTAKFNTINGGAHAKYMFPMSGEGKISPYVVGGAGMYNFKAKIESGGVSADNSENKVGGHGGLGFLYKASDKVGVGLEGAFHLISTTGGSTKYATVQAVVSVGMGSK